MSEELVYKWDACPECGERRIDYLVRQNDDFLLFNEAVMCSTCGTVYRP